ncbi:MAG: LPS export ABC transporter periplasmic protein LptC, partial [Verrucomicrobiae bacterium]|nr:LPS export ABC transporter periplasmic protein LptC [Verrucomicrobiae bacterium]
DAVGQEQDRPAIARPQEASAPPVSNAEKPAPAKTPPPADVPKSSEEEPAPEEGGIPPELASLFPIGRVFQGVRIPSYSGDSLGSVIHSQFMKRADDEHLEMEMLEIVIYNAGEPDTRILTDRAIFDTVAKTLRSTTPAKIVQSQFEMNGDRLIFDTNSRTGHLSGNVKTVIHDAENFSGQMNSKK